jgi:glycosyltransferase involved in cell wall biosynthesis
MRRFKLAIYARVANHHNALRLVVNEYVDACVRIWGEDAVAILAPRDQASRFAGYRNVVVLPFDSGNALASHLTTLLALPAASLFFPRVHVVIPQIAFVGPMAGGFTAVVHDVIEWKVRSQTWAKLLARRVLYRSTFRFARRIVCVSEATRSELLGLFPGYARKCSVVHNGVDALARVPSKPVPDLEGVDFVAVVGYVSEPQKNLLTAIEAFARAIGDPSLAARYPSLRLAFAGPPGLRATEVLDLARRRLGDRFTYLGVVEDGQVRWLFEHCQVALAASRAEGFSLTPAQALFHGGKVVASDIAPHREILGEGATYFDPASSDDCARALARALQGAPVSGAASKLPTWGDLANRLKLAMVS